MHMVRNTLNRMVSMIKRGVLSLPASDAGVNQTAQASYLGKAANVELISIYGLSSNPPVGSNVLLFNIQGQEENRAGIANFPGARFKRLKSGEVALGNYITKSNVTFLENGDIQITSNNDMIVNITNNNVVTIGGTCTINITTSATINCPQSTINGDVEINGNLVINGDSNSTGSFTTTADVVASGVSLNSHIHSGVTPGGGNTGGPV